MRKYKIRHKSLEDINILPDGRMSVKDAARYIDCSEASLRGYMMMGIAPAYSKVVNKTYFYKDDVDMWLELQKVSSTFCKNRMTSIKEK